MPATAPVAAHEVEIERFVALVHAGSVGGERDLLVGGNQADHQLLAQPPRRVRPDLIGEAPRRHGDQPAFRVVGHSLRRPLHRRGEQRFLDRVLASTEVAVAAHQRAQDLRREIAQQILGAVVQRGITRPASSRSADRSSPAALRWPGSTACRPGPGAADASAAIA